MLLAGDQLWEGFLEVLLKSCEDCLELGSTCVKGLSVLASPARLWVESRCFHIIPDGPFVPHRGQVEESLVVHVGQWQGVRTFIGSVM